MWEKGPLEAQADRITDLEGDVEEATLAWSCGEANGRMLQSPCIMKVQITLISHFFLKTPFFMMQRFTRELEVCWPIPVILASRR